MATPAFELLMSAAVPTDELGAAELFMWPGYPRFCPPLC